MKHLLRVALVVFLLFGLAVTPTVVAAQETRTGGTVVVEEGETVDDLTVAGGTVMVEGTVDGELTVAGGTVTIDGQVTEDVAILGGDVRITGDVGGDVEAIGGNVWIGETATVAGSVSVAAGATTVDGVVQGDLNTGAGTTTIGSTATVAGDLTYAGDLDVDPNAEIGGDTVRDPAVAVGPAGYPADLELVFAAYALVLNLLLGAILLALGPRFASAVSERFSGTSLTSAGVGLLTVIVVPILLGLLALTVVGLPLTLVGTLLFVVYLWIATVYGRFALGMWLISLVNLGNRWLALVIGLVIVAGIGRVPYAGSLIVLLVTLLGIGAVTLTVLDSRGAAEPT